MYHFLMSALVCTMDVLYEQHIDGRWDGLPIPHAVIVARGSSRDMEVHKTGIIIITAACGSGKVRCAEGAVDRELLTDWRCLIWRRLTAQACKRDPVHSLLYIFGGRTTDKAQSAAITPVLCARRDRNAGTRH
ncbi:hypothetical protein CERZMDRAFT_88590 [Cercospora zeae-maydis SCOH1-5]|uniref:Uncharacterized protein n=1 Tax=Cercospora zeae-maydis SCOH1-5 TaxID=717836 RepID=A0A6A6F4W6_9PEZI|nr:hypothetical protein CERZMDRAFT_88590 [Cercospora zeae-maydis SCOH1-5]